MSLTFDGDGNLIRGRLDTGDVFLGTYAWDGAGIALVTDDG